MDTSGLRAFCAAVSAGSLSAAARQLGISQPGLSRRVQRLEDELGVALLIRGAGGIRLTHAGQRFLTFATRTLAEYDAIRAEARFPAGAMAGTIGIVASTTPGEYLVPELVARFVDEQPGVKTREFVTDSAGVARHLLDHDRWDVGFSGRRVDHPRLRYEPIGQDEIVLAAPSSHPLAERSAVTVDDLAGQRLIQREEGSGTQQTFVDTLAAHGLALPPQPAAITLGSSGAVLSAVEASLGIGVVSLRAVEHHASQVRALRVVGVPVVRSLYVVHVIDRDLPAHVRAFIEFALDVGRGRDDAG
ncbi:MAG: LysR family transcriptional regulator [Actinomycetota bacterium]|nr:LysR family transcriptional regulator [Actinomycetota bacterium]